MLAFIWVYTCKPSLVTVSEIAIIGHMFSFSSAMGIEQRAMCMIGYGYTTNCILNPSTT